MRAAVVNEFGAPSYGPFDEPTAGDGQLVLDVLAAGVNHVDLAKCGGAFYRAVPPFPWVAGSDGVGRTKDGRRAYFDETIAPFGAMAERTLVSADRLFDVAEGVEDAVAAALGNAGLAAWLSLRWAAELQPGESVLVLGATGAVGSLAVQVARLARAGRVVGSAPASPRLRRLLELGADEVVESDPNDSLGRRMRAAAPPGFDVVVDPVWGEPALAALGAAAHGCRHIQVGHVSAPTITLRAAALRENRVSLIGFATFHVPIELRRSAYLDLTDCAARGEIEVDLETLPLSEVERAWREQAAGPVRKLVIVPRVGASPGP
jgi:NADPH:quinone reductase-like Zn-dependent oxidoreductase